MPFFGVIYSAPKPFDRLLKISTGDYVGDPTRHAKGSIGTMREVVAVDHLLTVLYFS